MKRGSYHPEDSEAAYQVKALMEDILLDKRMHVNSAAARLNITSERLYKYLNTGSMNNIPAYLVPIWTRSIGSEMIMWLAKEAGGAYVPLPRTEKAPMDCVKAATKVMRECADVLSTFTTAVDDTDITANELKSIRKEVTEAISALLALEMIAEREVENKQPKGRR